MGQAMPVGLYKPIIETTLLIKQEEFGDSIQLKTQPQENDFLMEHRRRFANDKVSSFSREMNARGRQCRWVLF